MNFLREPLESLFGWVKIGDLILYDDGHCRAGNRVFDYGVPIDDHVFGGTCILRRRIDEPEILEVQDGNETLRFEYSRVQAEWYRLTPLDSPRFDALQTVLGSAGANFAYQLWGLVENLLNELLATFANFPGMVLSLAVGYVKMIIMVLPLCAVFLLIRLLSWVFGN